MKIEIDVTTADGSKKSDEVIISVIIKNPCFDPDYVSIEAGLFADLAYNIVSEGGPTTYDPHTAFVVKTSPF